MFPENGKIWSNGQLIPWQSAQVHVMTHGLHYGSGVFEGIRAYHSESQGSLVFRLDEHLQRFLDSAKLYQFNMKYTFDELKSAVIAVIRENKFKDCYIRPVAFVGYGRLGVSPNCENIEVHVGAWPWGAYLGENSHEDGVRVTVTSWERFHDRNFPSTAKATGPYMNSMLAVMDAKRRGFDEAILLNKQGNLAEGSGENIFLVKNGKLFTNPPSASILAGITRETILTLANDLGYEVEVSDMTVSQLMTADEAFFTGTAVEVTPIREVDGRMIGETGRGPITQHIQETYFKVVKGQESKYEKWITPVFN